MEGLALFMVERALNNCKRTKRQGVAKCFMPGGLRDLYPNKMGYESTFSS